MYGQVTRPLLGHGRILPGGIARRTQSQMSHIYSFTFCLKDRGLCNGTFLDILIKKFFCYCDKFLILVIVEDKTQLLCHLMQILISQITQMGLFINKLIILFGKRTITHAFHFYVLISCLCVHTFRVRYLFGKQRQCLLFLLATHDPSYPHFVYLVSPIFVG